eukprot:6199642-Pleurochrysis_carterae.AAC.1
MHQLGACRQPTQVKSETHAYTHAESEWPVGICTCCMAIADRSTCPQLCCSPQPRNVHWPAWKRNTTPGWIVCVREKQKTLFQASGGCRIPIIMNINEVHLWIFARRTRAYFIIQLSCLSCIAIAATSNSSRRELCAADVQQPLEFMPLLAREPLTLRKEKQPCYTSTFGPVAVPSVSTMISTAHDKPRLASRELPVKLAADERERITG